MARVGPITTMQPIKYNPTTPTIPGSNVGASSFHFDDMEFLPIHLYSQEVEIDEHPGSFGSTSMFNEYNVLALSRIGTVSTPGSYDVHKLYDSPRVYKTSGGSRVFTEYDEELVNNQKLYKTPTASNIIFLSHQGTRFGFAKTPYSWADFLYCKYYGRIPNNNLITLRRYPYPVYDNLHTVKEYEGVTAVPVAQAVTWLGQETDNKISDILKFTFGVEWKEIEPMVQDIEGNEVGFGAGIESILGPNLIGALGSLYEAMEPDPARWSGLAQKEQNLRRKAWTDEGPYWNQVYGPVNVVHKTYMRERGVKFTNDIKIKFHYSLSSYNGVNPKVAFLDLITNFLSLTYTNTKWWGGSARYFPNYDDPVIFFGGAKTQEAFMNGDIKGYMEATKSEMTEQYTKISNEVAKIFSNGSGGIVDNLKNLGGDMATRLLQMVFGKLSRNSRPEFLSIRSLLSGRPVGEWHLTIGNPFNPMAVIGNLIVTDTEMEFNDVLGADDFPTEIIFTVSLKHARPRDKGDIESMFNYGQGRMSYSPLITLPSEQNTHGNNFTLDGNKTGTAMNANNVGTGGINANLNSEESKQLFTAQSEYQNTPTTEVNIRRIKHRMNKDWGVDFGTSVAVDNMLLSGQNKN